MLSPSCAPGPILGLEKVISWSPNNSLRRKGLGDRRTQAEFSRPKAVVGLVRGRVKTEIQAV